MIPARQFPSAYLAEQAAAKAERDAEQATAGALSKLEQGLSKLKSDLDSATGKGRRPGLAGMSVAPKVAPRWPPTSRPPRQECWLVSPFRAAWWTRHARSRATAEIDGRRATGSGSLEAGTANPLGRLPDLGRNGAPQLQEVGPPEDDAYCRVWPAGRIAGLAQEPFRRVIVELVTANWPRASHYPPAGALRWAIVG